MDVKKIIDDSIKEYINEIQDNYRSWKRKNVTLRGMKDIGVDNGVYGSFGKGLYTVPLSNRPMAKQYGEVYFVVNAIPKKPKIVDSLNIAEILVQTLIDNFSKENGRDYDRRFFEANTSIEEQMIKMGYDGLIIKGREMVNYTPPDDVMYFRTERELEGYYERNIM